MATKKKKKKTTSSRVAGGLVPPGSSRATKKKASKKKAPKTKTTTGSMQSVYAQAKALIDQKQYKAAQALLAPWEAKLPSTKKAGDSTAGAIANLLGICTSELAGTDKPGLKKKAIKLYEKAAQLGEETAILNLCDLDLNFFGNVDALIARAQAAADTVTPGGYTWFHLHNYLGLGCLRRGHRDDAVRAYHQIWQACRESERARIDEAVGDIHDLVRAGGAVDAGFANDIAAWLGVAPKTLTEAQRSQWRGWWSNLAAPLRARLGALLQRATELPLSDDEIDALAGVREVDVAGASVADVAPLAQLPALERVLAFSSPGVTGLSALAALKHLREVVTHGSADHAERTALRAARPDVFVD